jgi:hypothetical protein
VGDHALSASFAPQGTFTGSSATGVLHVNPAPTTTTLTASASPSSAGQSVTFTATVNSAAAAPAGTVTFMDGATVLGAVPVNGVRQAVLTTSTLALGEHTITAIYGGSTTFTGSSSPSLAQVVFAYATNSGGWFVIGDLNAAVGTHVTFWDAQWDNLNAISDGTVPASFKGFVNLVSTSQPGSGSTWSTTGGNSSSPPSTVPTYMAVLVSSHIAKAGSTISGNVTMLVIVKTDAGYSSNPGHPGTGTIVAVIR